jgi:hypothetical protein
MLTHVRFSRTQTEVTIRGFGFANSNFLHFAISTSDDEQELYIIYSKRFTLISDFEMRVTAFERVSRLM